MRSKFLYVLICAVALLGCNQPKPASFTEVSGQISFFGNTLNLDTLVNGFPYRILAGAYDARQIIYLQRGETDTLKAISLGNGRFLNEGKVLSTVDFSARNISNVHYRLSDSTYYWTGDESNDEQFNLWHLPKGSDEPVQLTQVPYVFGWRWNESQNQIAYVVREGERESRQGSLRLRSLVDNHDIEIARDVPGLRFTWGEPSWKPDSSGVILPVLRRADRRYANLVYVDFSTGRQTLLTDSSRTRNGISVLEDWASPTEYYYLSNESGFLNLYRGNIYGRGGYPLTTFSKDIEEVHLIERAGQKYFLITLSDPLATEILLINPSGGGVLVRDTVAGQMEILDVAEYRALVRRSAADNPFVLEEWSAFADTFLVRPFMQLGDKLQEALVQSTIKPLQIPTFDTLAGTNTPRMLHAYLYTPLNPLPKEKQILLVQSFYGGENRYSSQIQALTAAGIYVLSPAPRGSAGFGKDFAALNDSDLGGNEIMDIISCAEFGANLLGIPPKRIGAFGGSHGGYATMRLLTFSDTVNGYRAEFPWGFGLSHAGFSDILDFYKRCNIPDWVTLEAGDPVLDSAKLHDRSPASHAMMAKGPILLTHGTQDQRVPIQGSRMMADSLMHYSKPYLLIEFSGQGHSIQGKENLLRFYQTWFQFIEEVVTGKFASQG